MIVSVLNASTNAMYVRKSDITWLMQYPADDFGYGGVPTIEEDHSDVGKGNCRVEGLSTQWDFKEEKFTAEFVSGPCAGQKFEAGLTDINKCKYARMASAYD